MSKFARRLAHANTAEVHLDGAVYRIRKITSALLVEAGRAMLLMDATSAEEWKARIDTMTPEQQAEAVVQRDAVVCAAVTHAWSEGEDEEPLQIVLTESEADHEAGRLWLEHLPPDHVTALFGEAMKLAMGGARAKAIASFRAPAADAGDAGCGGP